MVTDETTKSKAATDTNLGGDPYTIAANSLLGAVQAASSKTLKPQLGYSAIGYNQSIGYDQDNDLRDAYNQIDQQNSGIGSGIGGAIGAGLGTLLHMPTVGAAAGSLLGGLVGSAFGGSEKAALQRRLQDRNTYMSQARQRSDISNRMDAVNDMSQENSSANAKRVRPYNIQNII